MPRIKENNIMVELRDRVEGDVPESLVEQAETSLLQDFFGQLQQAGMTFDALPWPARTSRPTSSRPT